MIIQKTRICNVLQKKTFAFQMEYTKIVPNNSAWDKRAPEILQPTQKYISFPFKYKSF